MRACPRPGRRCRTARRSRRVRRRAHRSAAASDASADRPLGRADRQRRHRGDRARELQRRIERRLRRHDAGHEAAASASRAVMERPVRMSSMARAWPMRPGQALRAARTGHDPDQDLGLPERRHRPRPRSCRRSSRAHSRRRARTHGPRRSPGGRSRRAGPTPPKRPPACSVAELCVASSLMSAPAAKARVPAPVSTMARQDGGDRAPRGRRPARRGGRSSAR